MNEALILWEIFRESQRLPAAAALGADFVERFKMAEMEAKGAELLLRAFAEDPKPELQARLDRVFNSVAETCVSCHKAFRDTAEAKNLK